MTLNRLKSRWQIIILALLLSVVAATLTATHSSEGLDRLLYDSAFRLGSPFSTENIVIIDIDEKSLAQLGEWPWPRSVHAQLLEKLIAAQAGTVVFDIIFATENHSDRVGDKKFAEAMRRHGSVVLPVYIEQTGHREQMLESPPARPFYESAAAVGHVHVANDYDGIVRSVFLMEGIGSPYWPHLSLAALQQSQNKTSSEWLSQLPGSRNQQPPNTQSQHTIARDYLNFIPMPAPGQGFLHLPYSDVLAGRSSAKLKDKTIFIGATAAGLGDHFTTSVGIIPGVELNALIYRALDQQQLISRPDNFSLIIFTGLSTFLLLMIIGHLSPKGLLAALLLLLAALPALSVFMQLAMQCWLPVSPVIIGILLFYPLWSWWRLELALAYLQREVNELSQANPGIKRQASSSTDISERYITALGVGEKRNDAQQSEKADLAPQLAWTAPLTTLDTGAAELGNQTGSHPELISRTLAQVDGLSQLAKQNRQIIRESLSNLQDGVIIADLWGNMVYQNQTVDKLLPTSSSESSHLLQRLDILTFKNEQSLTEFLKPLYEGERHHSLPARCEQRELLVQAALAAINSELNDAIILTFTDVTALRAAEKARLEALSFLSHDLRSPMVSVLALIEKERREKSSAMPVLETVEGLVQKNLHYAEEFLQLSKAQYLQSERLLPCDLHMILDSVYTQTRALAKAKNIAVQLVRDDEDAWVNGEESLLERALINLTSNAIKYSPDNSQLCISLEGHDQLWLITVADEGPGIPEEERTTIFQRFTRAKGAKAGLGAGLGLYFVATVAAKHQGKARVESEEGRGSRFSIELPRLEL